jgi:predicted Zn-dependent protease
LRRSSNFGIVKESRMIKALKPPNLHHLNAAEGWLGLGNVAEAEQELALLTDTVRAHPEVLRVRYHLYGQTKRWERAAETAQLLCQIVPETPFGWIHLAFALHELRRTREAYNVLLPVVDRFSDEYVIRYNLACYCCQLGELDEARAWLRKAMAIAGKDAIKQMASTDPDLQALATEIQGM